METNQTLTILGVNDEQTVCDACGRVELRRTVILGNREDGEVGRYGTTCAAKMLAYYEDVEADTDALVARFRAAHRHAVWEWQKTDAEILVMARDMFARRRAQVAAAELIGA